MTLLKTAARRLFKDYELYWLYESPDSFVLSPLPADLEFGEASSPDSLHSTASEIESLTSYRMPDSRCFVIRRGDEVVSACVYWWGETYVTHRNFWPLRQREAKLVQINTAPSSRGHGLASALIQHSAARMRDAGFVSLFARVWHSNLSSVKAFERAGWRRIAFRGTVQLPLIGKKTFTRRFGRPLS